MNNQPVPEVTRALIAYLKQNPGSSQFMELESQFESPCLDIFMRWFDIQSGGYESDRQIFAKHAQFTFTNEVLVRFVDKFDTDFSSQQIVKIDPSENIYFLALAFIRSAAHFRCMELDRQFQKAKKASVLIECREPLRGLLIRLFDAGVPLEILQRLAIKVIRRLGLPMDMSRWPSVTTKELNSIKEIEWHLIEKSVHYLLSNGQDRRALSTVAVAVEYGLFGHSVASVAARHNKSVKSVYEAKSRLLVQIQSIPVDEFLS
jgi:hypothetical protein